LLEVKVLPEPGRLACAAVEPATNAVAPTAKTEASASGLRKADERNGDSPLDSAPHGPTRTPDLSVAGRRR